MDNSRPSSRHWKQWAAGLRLEYSARPALVQAIDESDYSCWPTAVTQDSESAARHTTETGVMHSGTTLTDAAREWQTPATDSFRSRGGDRKDEMGLDQEARNWQTPRACSGERSSGSNRTKLVNAWPTPRANPEAGASPKTEERGLTGPNLQEAANQWRTPTAQSPNSLRGSGQDPEKREAQGHAVNLTDQASAWATPAVPNGGRINAPGRISPTGMTQDGQKRQIALESQTASWPTPITRDHRSIHAGEETMEKNSRPLSEMVGDWSTPRATDGETGTSQFSPPDPATQDGQTSSDERRTLNPRFVEWLHGWPIGLTSLEPVETELCHWLPRMRGALSRLLSARADETQGRLL